MAGRWTFVLVIALACAMVNGDGEPLVEVARKMKKALEPVPGLGTATGVPAGGYGGYGSAAAAATAAAAKLGLVLGGGGGGGGGGSYGYGTVNGDYGEHPLKDVELFSWLDTDEKKGKLSMQEFSTYLQDNKGDNTLTIEEIWELFKKANTVVDYGLSRKEFFSDEVSGVHLFKRLDTNWDNKLSTNEFFRVSFNGDMMERSAWTEKFSKTLDNQLSMQEFLTEVSGRLSGKKAQRRLSEQTDVQV